MRCAIILLLHYQLDGSPYLWHFTWRCCINLLPFAQTGSASLELVLINAEKVTISAGSDEVFLAERGVQTEIESVSVEAVLVTPNKSSIQAGPDEVSFVDQTAQTHFSDLSTPNDLAGSQSNISE